jgi:hypothetical protein
MWGIYSNSADAFWLMGYNLNTIHYHLLQYSQLTNRKLLVTAATTNYIKNRRIERPRKPAQNGKKPQHTDSFNDNQSISYFLDLKICDMS